MKQRALYLFLFLCLALTLMTGTALAAEPDYAIGDVVVEARQVTAAVTAK